jgi:mannose-6-phosphate isomerase-like protein (cupin superfamily)
VTETLPADPANPWGTFLNVQFGPLELSTRCDGCRQPAAGFNRRSRANDCVFGSVFRGSTRLRHDEDELFFVFEGGFELDVEGREAIALAPGQGAVVPRGVRHRPRSTDRTVVLMVEGAGVTPTGD